HKRGVAFVGMPDAGSNSQRSQDTNSTNAEDDLLPDPMFFVAAIQARRQFTIPVRVLVDIGVHEIQRGGTEIYTPNFNEHAKVSNIEFDQAAFIGPSAGRLNWRV